MTSGGQEIRGSRNFRIPVSDFGVAQAVQIKVTATDGVTTKTTLTTEPLPPTATPTHTPTAEPTATPTDTPTPTITPTLTPTAAVTPTLCKPAVDLGASIGPARPRTDDTTAVVRYPKLTPDYGGLTLSLNKTIQIYTSALQKGHSADEAFEKANLRYYYDFIILPPDSKFPEHRIAGYIRFQKSPALNLSSVTDLLKGFLKSQGVGKDVKDVFGDYRFYEAENEEGYPELWRIDLPFTLMGPLSELPGIKSVNVIWGVYHVETNDVSPTNPSDRDPVGGSVNNISSKKSNAAKWHGADAWHKAGYTGKSIKIGVIDGDFDGLIVY